MVEQNEKRSHILATTLVVAVIFQIGLSVLILRELRTLPASLAGGIGAGPAAPQGLAPGTQAPEFRLTDAQGKAVSLADFSGRRVMLVFSSDQCRYCKQMYPKLKRFRESGEPPDLEVVMLQVDSTPESNRDLSHLQGFDFPVLAADQETFLEYEVPGTPFATVVNEMGVITASGVISSYEEMAGLATKERS